jgi:hypothetical protein
MLLADGWTEQEITQDPPYPFRYFGEYSRFEDLLTDPEGRPKAVSRYGFFPTHFS